VGISWPEVVYIPHIISGRGKYMKFKFYTNIHRIDQNKRLKLIKNFANSCRGRSQNSQQISEHPYIGRIARSFLRQHVFLVIIRHNFVFFRAVPVYSMTAVIK